MSSFMKVLAALTFMFAIGWFVSFQYDPYNVCLDHPDPKMKKDFYICEPLGFTLQKGTLLERRPQDRFIWEKRGGYIIDDGETKKRRNSDTKRNRPECNPEVIMQDDNWEENIDQIPDYCLEDLERLDF